MPPRASSKRAPTFAGSDAPRRRDGPRAEPARGQRSGSAARPPVSDKKRPAFIVSLFAVIVPAILIALLFLRGPENLLFGSSEWLYPASLLGFSLTEISLAMTWEGSSSRKTISI